MAEVVSHGVSEFSAMTILNYICTPKRAVLAIDTAGTAVGPRVHSRVTSKAIAFGAQNLVIASRGSTDIVASLSQMIHAHSLGFDDLAKVLQQGLPPALKQVLGLAAAQDPPVELPKDVEIVILGWSAERARLSACYFKSDDEMCSAPDFADHKHLPNEGLDFKSVVNEPSSKVAMLKMMQRQKGWGDSHGYQGQTGGAMVHFDMSKLGVAIDSSMRI